MTGAFGVKTSPLPGWQSLYHAAMFGTDRAKAPQRIADAESQILARRKELSALAGDHIEEEVILEDALYALHALRNSISGIQAA